MAKTDRGRLRVIDVITQHVEGVVHAAAEVEAVEVLREVLPPAHIQQVAGELVKALELSSGGDTGKGEMYNSSCNRQLPAQAGRKPLPTSPSPKAVHSALGPLKASSHGIPPFLIHSCVQSFTKDQPPRASGDWGQYFLFHLCSYFSVPPNLEQGSIYIGAYLQKTQQKCQSVMRSAFPKKTGSEA